MQNREVTMDDLVRQTPEIWSVRRLVQFVLFLMVGFWFVSAAVLNPLSFTAILPALVVLVIAALASNLPYQYGSSMPMPAPWMLLIFLPPALVLFASSFIFVGTASTVWTGPCITEFRCTTSFESPVMIRIPFWNSPSPIPAFIEAKHVGKISRGGIARDVELYGRFEVNRTPEMAKSFAVDSTNPRLMMELRAANALQNHLGRRGGMTENLAMSDPMDDLFREDLRLAGLIWNGEVRIYGSSDPLRIIFGPE